MGYVWRDACREAQDILDEYWDRRMLPVDVERVCLLMNVIPVTVSLPGGLSGLLVKRGGEREARIYVDVLESHVRRRFLLAHMLGHCVERIRLADDYEFGFHEARNYHDDDLEFFADEFAGTLLMPENEIRRFRAENMTVGRMAKRFDVGVGVMRRRLLSLGKTDAMFGQDRGETIVTKPDDRELERMREEYRIKTERDERISRLAWQCRMERRAIRAPDDQKPWNREGGRTGRSQQNRLVFVDLLYYNDYLGLAGNGWSSTQAGYIPAYIFLL